MRSSPSLSATKSVTGVAAALAELCRRFAQRDATELLHASEKGDLLQHRQRLQVDRSPCAACRKRRRVGAGKALCTVTSPPSEPCTRSRQSPVRKFFTSMPCSATCKLDRFTHAQLSRGLQPSRFA
jgi:hypothetical protein